MTDTAENTGSLIAVLLCKFTKSQLCAEIIAQASTAGMSVT